MNIGKFTTWQGETMTLNWDPSKYKTKAGAAKSLYKALCAECVNHGQDPKWEVSIRSPKENVEFGYGPFWQVGWEAGPYDWAVEVSLRPDVNQAPWGYVEPYYSFNLEFSGD